MRSPWYRFLSILVVASMLLQLLASAAAAAPHPVTPGESLAVAPGAFGKSSPANGATGQPNFPVLRWNAASGVVTYGVCLDTTNDAACTGGDAGYTRVGNVTSWTPPASLTANTAYYWQVRAYDAANAYTPADAVGGWWSFTTGAIPGAFGKRAPASNASNQPNLLTLAWSAAPGATEYAYCLDTTNDNACKTLGDADYTRVGGATSAAIVVEASTTYYWQVRAYNGIGSVTPADGSGGWWTFSTGPAPGNFGKVAPANGGAGEQPNTVTFRWNAAGGAVRYGVCYDTTNDNACKAGGDAEFTNVGNTTSWTPPGALTPGTTYYWQVRAYNNIGSYTPADGSGGWWSFATPTAPTAPGNFGKASPADGATNVASPATLRWNVAPGATEYRYCLIPGAGAACPNGDSGFVSVGTATSVARTDLAPGSSYSWQVRAYNAAGQFTVADGVGNWWRFTTAGAVALPGAFSKSSPANGATNQPISVTLTWQAATGAVEYGFCIDPFDDNACRDGDAGYQRVGGTSATVTLSPGTAYFWQVRAYNALGQYSVANGAGTWWNFKTAGTAPPPPAAFGKTAPANNAIGQPVNLVLAWQAAGGAVEYGFCLDTTNDNACVGGDAGYQRVGNVISWTLPAALAPNTTYYWQVRAYNATGGYTAANNSGGWWSFSTASGPPAPFSKMTPTNGTTELDTRVTLSWAASPGATGYGYCVDTSDDDACDNGDAGYTRLSATSVTKVLQPGTTYYWQARAYNASGYSPANGVGEWWTFTTQGRQVAGYLQGQFGVNEAGAATYSLPLVMPPGAGGVVPQIAVAYDSRGGNSLVGWATALTGLSLIGRCPQTLADHGQVHAVDFTAADRFCLDGQLLAAVQGEYGADGTVYRTQNDAFSKIVSYGSASGAPQSFKAWTKAGLVLEYGATEDSRVEAQGRPNVLYWGVSRVTDTLGNYYAVTYVEANASGEAYPVAIDYTGNAARGVAPNIRVAFAYEARPDVTTHHVGGAVIRLARRLVAIQISFQENGVVGELIREYRFGYEAGEATGRSRLTNVTECAGARDGSCLAATRFAWTTPAAADSNFNGAGTGTWNAYAAGVDRTVGGDFDGDGRADLAGFGGSGQWSVCLSRGTGFACSTWAGHNGGIERNVAGDFNGDGRTDLAGFGDAGRWDVCLSTGAGFACSLWMGHNGGAERSVAGDFDGDGRTDLAGYGDTNQWHVCLSTGSGFDCTFWTGHGGGMGNNVAGDFNGDGRLDLAGFSNENQQWDVCLSTGSNFACAYWKGHTGGVGSTVAADFDGDGLTNLAGYSAGNQWDVCLSTGAGFDCAFWTGHGGGARYNATGDYNGDGRADLAAYSSEEKKWHVCLSVGDNFRCAFWTGHGGGSGNNVGGDYNGDGKTDLAGFTGTGVGWHVTLAGGILPDQLTTITNGHGSRTSITYRPLTDTSIYTRGTGAAYPQRDLQSPMYVVASYRSSNGLGAGENEVRYAYSGLRFNVRGRGFLGFASIKATDQTTGLSTTTEYSQSHPYKSLATKVTQALPNGTVIQRTTSTWDSTKTGDIPNAVYFLFVARSVEERFELDGSAVSATETETTYDAYGNATRVVVRTCAPSCGAAGAAVYTRTTVGTFTNDTGRWFLGRLTRAEVTAEAPNQPAQTRVSTWEYNPATGQVVREEVEPGTPLADFKTYEHDGFGNIVRSTVGGPDVDPRTQATVFNDRGRFAIASVNALGHREERQNDNRFGKPTSVKGPNGLVTTRVYDGFERIVEEARPDGTRTKTAYTRCTSAICPTNAVYFVRVEVSATVGGTTTTLPATVQYFDLLDRVIREETVGFDGKKIYVDTEYDERGQVKRRSEPYFAGQSTLWTTFTYDILGRELTQTRPDGTKLETEYQGLTTRVTSVFARNGATLRQTAATVVDAEGRRIRSVDTQGNTVEYTYDSVGNLVRFVDPAGTTTTMQYDRRGRKIATSDPDGGATTVAYNAFGEVVWERNARGQVTAYTYDALGRLVRREEPEGASTWRYDTYPDGRTKWLGALSELAGPGGYAESYSYDNLGRPSQTVTTIDGQAYTVATAYDPFGRVDRLTYPTGFAIRHIYNAQGYLAEVRDAGNNDLFWRAVTVNARGQTEKEDGNGLTTARTFDPKTGRLTALRTGKGAGSAIQDLTFAYDGLGNVTSRADGNQRLTENFTYDDLNRLTQAQIVGRPTQAVAYDRLGNITSKQPVVPGGVPNPWAYRYGETSNAGPHAVTSVSITGSTIAYAYDASGNRTGAALNGRTTETIGYTSYDLPHTITRGDITLGFSYAPDRDRYKKVTQDGAANATTTTVYIGGIYEVDRTGGQVAHRFYIAGGTGLAAIRLADGVAGTTNVRTIYMHKDHLGSTDAVTDGTGKVVERPSFDAWGAPRLPDWREKASVSASVTNRGYTGHEQLDLVGLVHMNGRVYDPQLGRFLSPDPVIQEVGNLQNLNGYSYVLNNPLTLTDPSGMLFSGLKHWFKNNWRTLLPAVLAIAGAWYIGSAIGGLSGAITGGAAGGFIGGVTGTLLNGGSFSQALVAGLRGAVVGGASAAAFYGIGSLYEAKAIGDAVAVIAHGTVGGLMEVAQGGKFEHGFLSAAVVRALAPTIGRIDPKVKMSPYRIAAAAVVGGTASVLGGGKFANGAITGAYSELFNQQFHADEPEDSVSTTGKLDSIVSVIVNDNTAIIGTHVGVHVVTPEDTVLYDPNGHYRIHSRQRGSDDTLRGKSADLIKYLQYQRLDGPDVTVYQFAVTSAQANEILSYMGGCPDLSCSACSGNVLKGTGPFATLGSTITPAGMKSEMNKLVGR